MLTFIAGAVPMRVRSVNDKADKTLTEIEASQSALRKSIEVTNKLSAQIERLLKRHRKELEQGD